MSGLLGSGSVHLQGRYKGKGLSTSSAAGKASAQCQKCLQHGHWTYECKNAPVYHSRPSRTQQLLNPKVRPSFADPADQPPEIREAAAKKAAEAELKARLAQKSQKKLKKRRRESSSGSDSDSDSDSGSSSSSDGSSSSSDGSSRSSSGNSSSSSSADSSSSSSSSSSSDSGASSKSSSPSGAGSSDEEAPRLRGPVERVPIRDEDRWQPDNDDHGRGLDGHHSVGARPSGYVSSRIQEERHRSQREVAGSRGEYENRHGHSRHHATSSSRHHSPRDSRRDRGSDYRRTGSPGRH
ncbi:hypothetical protein WJX74_003513 [Apatococcus lobatus]|uniref:Zinc knuckle-domain-containing protein n=1 Tax=Apatococcus lobatus TaxID=904363 RepID=A0AAW1QII6_9CHLO